MKYKISKDGKNNATRTNNDMNGMVEIVVSFCALRKQIELRNRIKLKKPAKHC